MGRWEDDTTIAKKIEELTLRYGHVLDWLDMLLEHPRFAGLYLLLFGMREGHDDKPNDEEEKQ